MELDSTLLNVLHEFAGLDDFILNGGMQAQSSCTSQQGSPQNSIPISSIGFQGSEYRPGSESSLAYQQLAVIAGPAPESNQIQTALALLNSVSENGKEGKRNRDSSAACNPKGDIAALQRLRDEKHALLERLQQENTILRKRSRMLLLIVNCRDEQVRRLHLLKSGQVVDDPFIPLGTSMKDVIKNDPLTFMPKWKLLCNELGTYLMEDPSLNNTKLLQLERAMLESYKYVFLVNPEMLGLSSKHVNSEGRDEEWHAPEGWWQQVVAQMRETFSMEQLEDTCLLHEMYCTWHNRLMEERQPLVAALSSFSSDAPRYGKGIHDAATTTVGCSSHVAEGQLVQNLQQNLMKERCLIVLICEVWFVYVLNPLQCAQVKFHSYPHMPDNIALLAATAALVSGGSASAISNGASGSGRVSAPH